MLPLTTTTVTIDRPVVAADPDDAGTIERLFTALAATVSAPSGNTNRAGGAQEIVDAVLQTGLTDPALTGGDLVADDVTGDRWTVVWARQRRGLGLDHQQAGLRAVTGSVPI